MHRGFTRGLVAGAIIGATVGMMLPSRTNARLRRKAFMNGKGLMRRAGSIIGNMVDSW